MSVVDVLAAGGILRPADVVAIAGRAGLELAAAATLLQMESGGGQNIYGHDNVPTGGAYIKGGSVTQQNYAAYLAAVKAGRAGRQGVGPTQLTWSGFQTLADARGGCWQWEINCAVGFEILAGHIREHGARDGFRAYNGTGPAAEAYADRAMSKLAAWRAKLPPTTPQENSVSLDDADVQRIADAVWAKAIRNAFGDTVQAVQVLNGIEQRVSDVQAHLEPHA